tara:strand:- start:142 stop:537 length:396 start_codon:yes stop_codon:yes gene_type:complete
MSEISFNFKIESDENLSESQVMGEIKNYTEREFNRVVFFEKQFSLIIKSKLLNPVVKFKGNIDLKVKDKKSKIFLNVNTNPNGWFWFELVLGFFLPFIWILLVVQWYTQKNKSSKLFNNLGNHLDSKFSKF